MQACLLRTEHVHCDGNIASGRLDDCLRGILSSRSQSHWRAYWTTLALGTKRANFEFVEMNGSVKLDEASQPCFDASSSKLAWGSSDGRLRLFDVNAQQIVADITQDLSNSSIADNNISKSVYSCLSWGQGKVRRGK